jgi:RND family efflux transporter MFP subunit
MLKHKAQSPILAAIAILSAGALLTGCSNSKAGKTPGIPAQAVSVQSVGLSNQSIGHTYLGTITPFIQTSLAPGAAGQLSELNVRAGQTIKAGQVLASLNASTIVPQQNAAEQAGVALISAQQQYADALAMYNDNTNADQQVTNAQSAVTEQSAAVKAAEANLQKAQLAAQGILDGTATTTEEKTALQSVIDADTQALDTAKQNLQLAESNLTILQQTLDTAKESYASITEDQVQKASTEYQDALSHFQSWQQGAYGGSNPYQSVVSADQQVYQNLSTGYNTLQSAQQAYNQGVQAIQTDKNGIAQAQSNLANAQKAAADGAPPASDSNTAQQANAGVKAAQASLDQTKAQYNASVTSLNLAKKMANDKTQAKQSLDNAANGVRQNQTAANTAQKTLQVQIQNGKVISPIAGVVQSVGAEVGQQVGPQTNLVTIATTSPQMATVNVPESDIGKFKKDGVMNVTVPTLNQTFTGHILAIHPQLDETTNSYPVDVTIDGNHAGLLPGLQVEAQLTNTTGKKAILVPADAVLSLQSGAEEVFVETAGTVHSRIVQVGSMSSTQYEITSGLTVGEKLVVQGQNLLSDNDKVKIVSEDGSNKTKNS